MNGLINNEWDRNNLNFLLHLDEQETKDWYHQSDEDDRVYAQELLDAYALELKVQAEELKVEAQLQMLECYDDALKIIEKVKNA